MSTRIKSDHDANGPNGLSWKKGQTVTVDDDSIARDLLQHPGFTEIGTNAATGEEQPADGLCPTCGQARDTGALPAQQPVAPGPGREVITPAAVTGAALGGPVQEGVTPEVTDDQAAEDRATAGGTKPAKGTAAKK